ncbi:M56 family metallopeptidase [Dyella amyloliquefaciens]|uniref:M56 family metallopeptidase n=1 Tax=Dyella amyloliquefaciens TaxID=1770545 RepID=UPI00102E7E1A|nr:M56 family metallopeptidase [Dyella amyloliquefaciens]
MSSLESWVENLAAPLGMLLLVFTLGSSLVLLLRGPARRAFGAERAAQLWWLPLAMLVACLLPHPASMAPGAGSLPRMVVMIQSVTDEFSRDASSPTHLPWRVLVLLLWLAGVLVLLLGAALAQRRYRHRLRTAVAVTGWPCRWPIRRAESVDIGPALVGAWRVCIVLPADFEHRYEYDEQVLVVAHESMHAQRRDGCWCLLAGLVLALFWFHPMAWWCWRALRQDLELACDAAVLRQSGVTRRRYADALLKTQPAAWALPVGCSWSSQHPLMERIAMLKLPTPGRRQHLLGTTLGALWLASAAGWVYAASTPASTPVPGAAASHEYQLDLKLAFTTDGEQHRHTERSTLALCMADGQAGEVRVADWTVKAITTPSSNGTVAIDLSMSRAGAVLAHQQLQGPLNTSMHAVHEDSKGGDSYVVDVVPRAGCPARAAAETSPSINEHVVHGQVRDVAQSVASKAGWTLANPDTLGNGVISLNFEDVPAREAMRLVAATVNMQPVFEGKQVRFEPK